ncbi:MAG: PP2C family serine/threonine-protein phosphatase [Candidatus Subteraquimicrobiales bacterium]|nr:PP2C family serine/threonine-protein phosphatase [Candidatus Subteraquimicrobiales bacterium]
MTNSSWRCVRASAIGTAHLATDKKCQDANEVLFTKDSSGEAILGLVASDGAGSAERSDEGSQLVCKEFVGIVAKYFADGGTFTQINSELLDAWTNGIQEAIREKAASSESVPRDFACTFLALIVGQSSAIAAQIGDGAIVIGCDGLYETVIWPQSGEYVNATYFITDDSFISNLHVTRIDRPIDEAAIFTDGIQMLALHYATQTVFEPFFRPMFDRLRKEPPGECYDLNESLAEYLISPLINERTDDDKTLILATRYQG